VTALVYPVLVATFPDEKIYQATNWLHRDSYRDFTTGELRWRGRPIWYDSIAPANTLDLRGEGLIDYPKLENITKKNKSETSESRWEPILLLAKRDLTEANLSDTDIRQIEFSDAVLNRANLSSAWAKNAHFDRAQLPGAFLKKAQLEGASLSGAQLQGASLSGARLQGASLRCARYAENKAYDCAQLQGASLDEAELQGASLDEAELQGASLDEAQLQGATLDGAQLRGASLNGIFFGPDTQLQGASLDHAQLQGASLNDAQLQGASFGVCAWRADARWAAWKDTRVTRPEMGPKVDKVPECDWTVASLAALKQLIAKEVPQGENKRLAMERIEQRLDPTKALEGDKEMAKIWAAREREAPAPEAYEKSLAGQWRELGCDADSAPYVLHGLIARLSSSFRDQSDAAKALAAALLDEADCAGAHGLSEADKAKLKKIAGPAAPQAPKP